MAPQIAGPFFVSLRGQDLNLRPLGYEPSELPNCSTPRYKKQGYHSGRAARFGVHVSGTGFGGRQQDVFVGATRQQDDFGLAANAILSDDT
jgi:hypothetical protein